MKSEIAEASGPDELSEHDDRSSEPIKKDLRLDEAAELLDKIYSRQAGAERSGTLAQQAAAGIPDPDEREDAPEGPRGASPAEDQAVRAKTDAGFAPAHERQLESAIGAFRTRYGTIRTFDDVVALAQADPEGYAQFMEDAGALEAGIKQQRSDEQARRNDFSTEQWIKLQEAWPEMHDTEEADRLIAELTEYGVGQGFDVAELSGAGAREIQVLRKAMMWDRAQTSRDKARKAGKGAASVQSPGGRDTNSPSGYQAALARLKKTGRLEDAAKALEYIIH